MTIPMAALCLLAAPVHAQTADGIPTPAPVVASPIPAAGSTKAVLRAGTPVQLQMMEEVTTKKKAAKVGQRIQLEIAAPVEVNGVVVIPAGTPAWGEIVSVRNKGMWGKSGHLDARLLFARVNGRQIRLTGSFDDKGKTGTAGVVGAVALLPVAGFFMTGTSAVLPKGMPVGGFVDEDVQLAIANSEQAPMRVDAAASATPVPATTPSN